MAPELGNVQSLFEEILPEILSERLVDCGRFFGRRSLARGSCRFVFTGPAGGTWTMEIAPEGVKISADGTQSDCTVSMAADLLVRPQRLDRRALHWLLLQRVIQAEGDMQVVHLALFILARAIRRFSRQRSRAVAVEQRLCGQVPELLFCISHRGTGCWDGVADALVEQLQGQVFRLVRQAATPCEELLRACREHQQGQRATRMFDGTPRIVMLDLLADVLRFAGDSCSVVGRCQEALRAVTTALHDADSRVIVANLFPYAPRQARTLRRELNGMNLMLMALSRETGLCIADVRAAVAAEGGDFVQADYLLGTPAAATLTAEAVAHCLLDGAVLDEFNEQLRAKNG